MLATEVNCKLATIKSKKNYDKKLQLDFFVVSVTEFNTKILEAFVKERKVSFLSSALWGMFAQIINWKLENNFVKEISFPKNWSLNVMSVTWNCPHDFFEETGVKVTFKTLLCPYTVIEKLCRWIFLMKIEFYICLVNDRTEVFIE